MSAATKFKPGPPVTVLDAALWAIEAGLWPVPIIEWDANDENASKRPANGRGWGAKRLDAAYFRSTLAKRPKLGVGLKLGTEGGIIDIDVDDPPAAVPTLARLFPDGLPPTLRWENAPGRIHLVFRYDDRLAQLAKTIVDGRDAGYEMYAGIEVRIGAPPDAAKQIQTVIPPSRATDGTARRWTNWGDILTLPEHVVADLLEHGKGKPRDRKPKSAPDRAAGLRSGIGGPPDKWASKAFADEVDKVRYAPPKTRNNQIYASACKLGEIIGAGVLDRSTVEAALWGAIEDLGKATDESLRTMRGGLDKGIANPRDLSGVGTKVGSPRPTIGVWPGPGDDTNMDADDPHEARPNEEADDPHRLARVYLNANHRHPDHATLVYHNGEFHRWDTAYRPVPIQAVRAALTTSAKAEFDRLNLIDLAEWKDKGSKGRMPTVGKVTTALTNNVVQALGGETLLDGRHAAPCWLTDPARWPAAEVLPTRNALLHLPSYVDGAGSHRIPPTPRFFCPYATDYDFDESAPAPANWLAFLDQLWPDDPDTKAALQEWMGYHLTPDTSQEKIGMLIGPKRCGKGTIAKVLTAMIGEANVCNPKIGSLGSQFGVESLIGKMAAIITDARITGRTDIAQVVENLLTISGTDGQTIPRKHKTDWSGNLPTKFTIISNELPRLADASGALPGRMIIFQLKRSFYGQEDTKLFARKIRPELPGILLWAIEGWKRLRDRGRLNQPLSGQQLVQEMEELSSPISVFLREKCVIEPGRDIMTTEMYKAWVEWCESMGNKHPGDEPGLGRNLRSAMPNLVTKPCRLGNGWGRKYMGIDLANPPARSPY